MTKAVKGYVDTEKARKYRNKQRKINYDAVPGNPNVRGTRWSKEHMRMVVEHNISDRELAKQIGRSTRAIQAMRMRIRNGDIKLETDIQTCRYLPAEFHSWFDENGEEHDELDTAPDDGCDACMCTRCGYEMMAGEMGWFDEELGEYGGWKLKPRFKYCPNCGAKVIE